MTSIKRIEHVAIVVEDLEDALHFWRDTLGLEVSGVKDIPKQQSKVAFLPSGNAEIELVEPTTTDSGISRFLAKRGQGMHHLCLEVENLDDCLDRLRRRGVRLISEEPTQDEHGRRMAFIHPQSACGVLVELYEAGH